MNTSFAPLLILLVTTAFAASASESRILFSEAFDNTGNQPSGFTDACAIHEAPPSLKTLAFRPLASKTAEVYQGLFLFPQRGTPTADYEFRFKFAFPRESKKSFTLTLVCGEAGDRKSHAASVLTLSEKLMGIRPPAPGLLPPFGGKDEELDLRPMPDSLWHNAVVRSRGKTLELFVENDGVLRKFAQAEVPGLPLVGFNFAGTTAVDFDDLEIRRLDPLPAGNFRTEGGVKTALHATEHTLAIPANATSASASFRLGSYPAHMALKLRHADSSERVLDVRTFASFYDKTVGRSVNELDPAGKLVAVPKALKERQPLRDAGLVFRERGADPKAAWSLTFHTRPNLRYRYLPDRELQIASLWETFPAASQKFIQLELRSDALGTQLWLDGRYAGRFDSPARVTELTFVLPAHAAIKDERIFTEPFSTQHLVLDVNHIANPGAFADARVTVAGKPAGAQTVAGIPLLVADGPGNADTGVCRENLGSFALECDGYLARTPFDGMPESLLLSVPVAQYHRAWLLCAVEDDPDKVPILTARLTKFLPASEVGRGPAIADTEVTLPRPGEPLPAGVKQVGEVQTSGGKSLPLYLVECRLDSGSIQEIIFQEKPAWLDFEVLGKRNDKDNFYFDRSRKPADERSGVHVFAATLERPPVEMHVLPASFGNIYQPGEKPAMTATLHARERTTATLAWTVRDLAGKTLEQGSKTVAFAQAGEVVKVETPFAQRELGWYRVDFQLTGAGQSELLRHTAYFSLIASDQRKAGYTSPYFTWNFGGAHGTIKDIAVAGPLLLKAGIRSTHVESEAVGAPWKLTKAQISRLSPRGKDPQAAAQELEKLVKEQVAKFPHATMALVFHESGGGPFPLELVGGKTEVDDKQKTYDQAKADHLALMAKAYRQLAPHIKLVVGNSGMGNPGLLASLFRAKVPRAHIDFIGEESVGMTMPPEISVGRENWLNQEVARHFGYGEIPISACYEWKARRSRHLGLERHAEWNVRDVLIGHAWRQPLIPTAGLPDVTFSYNNSVWGDGAFTHNPQVYPKPTYPAVATATLVLDCAKFIRMVPTGSLTVYALEFQRDGEFVHAFWTARGELDATLEFERDATLMHTELFGRSTTLKTSARQLKLRLAEGASYLTSPVALKSVTALGERTFPREQLPANAQLHVASKMDQLADWKLDPAVDPRLDVPAKAPVNNTSFRRPGKYELRTVKDETHGDCLELELIPDGPCPALMQEYTFLRLAKPIALPGTPATVALRVKGNSSWGKVFWEIEDAEGERWLSAGTGGYGCDVYDWPEHAGLNFDGWNHLQFPITARSPITVNSPGQNAFQWQHNGTGNGKMDYPIKLTALAISMPRQVVNLLKMEPVKTSIRLGGLGAY